MTEKQKPKLVAYLESLEIKKRDKEEAKKRRILADLRAGFTNPLKALTHIAWSLSEKGGRREEDDAVLLAGLFALHPEPGSVSLAAGLRPLAEKSESIELRFRALLDCDREDLGVHLRHAVSLVGSAETAIDFNDLQRAIWGWSHEDRYVQRGWARAFWAGRGAEPSDVSATTEA